MNKVGINIEQDFFELYHYWYIKLYSFIFNKTQCPDISEDVVQQTFLKVWERRQLFNEKIVFSSQLFQISRTTLIDELRKQAQKRKYLEHETPLLMGQFENMEAQLISKDQLNQLKSLIKQMPMARQRVFYMHKFEELSYKEIATQLSISIKTVENHMLLALKFVKKIKAFL